MNMGWDHTQEHGLIKIVLVDEYLLHGVNETVLEILLLEHVRLNYDSRSTLDLTLEPFYHDLLRYRVHGVLAMDLVIENALAKMLTLTLEGEEILISLLVILSIALLAQVEASTADEASLPVVIWDLTELNPTHDRVRAHDLPIFFHYLNYLLSL
jgi:hypothetical protein